MAQLRQAAALLPLAARDRFLRRVAAHLDAEPTNDEVASAIAAVLSEARGAGRKVGSGASQTSGAD